MKGGVAVGDLQDQIDDLVRELKANRVDLDALGSRADAAEMRADAAELRANVSEVHAQYADRRADVSEAKAKVDRDMIAELQREGVLAREHAGRMEAALKSSRTVPSGPVTAFGCSPRARSVPAAKSVRQARPLS